MKLQNFQTSCNNFKVCIFTFRNYKRVSFTFPKEEWNGSYFLRYLFWEAQLPESEWNNYACLGSSDLWEIRSLKGGDHYPFSVFYLAESETCCRMKNVAFVNGKCLTDQREGI